MTRPDHAARPEQMRLPVVIFDGDDTLWETQSLYSSAKGILFRILNERGMNLADAEERLEAIEVANLTTLSYSPLRFPQSLLSCYREMLAAYSLPTREAEERAIELAGRAVFSRRARVTRSAPAVLRRLRSGFCLALLTRGDQATQLKRLHDSKLRGCFDIVRIVQEKSADSFASLLAEARCDPTDAWSIGNSVRFDINPALSLGMAAIWLRTISWSHDDEEPQRSERLFVVDDLREVLGLLL